METIGEYKVHNIFCIATSALRDAPNRRDFIGLVRKNLGLSIKIIDGDKEAFYGAIATLNLLPIEDGITVDIGGGSTDMALLKGGRVVATHSMDLGTVRLSELRASRGEEYIRAYIAEKLSSIPDSFVCETVIGIGGTLRALSKAIMKKNSYPFDKLHAFRYSIEDETEFIERVSQSPIEELPKLNIKKSRYDTIREGASIFSAILPILGAKSVITSGAGIREGVFLSHILRNDSLRFPKETNPSIRSICDRLDPLKLPGGKKISMGKRLFDLLSDRFGGDDEEKRLLTDALRISAVGRLLTIYKEHLHAFYIASQELNYGYTHSQMLTIAIMLRSGGKDIYHKPFFKEYRNLLPAKKKINWMTFIYILTVSIAENAPHTDIVFSIDGDTLILSSDTPTYLLEEALESIEIPEGMQMEISAPSE
jgi:exopolyphosphatase/guanosine-5'-triphosphate,3'-diphosphate pyrophosphatase